ncbi:hypothetical protein [Emticicia sp. W12TSBA100-4]|uniref:hypothetical protein n=1 Tax=Emticicia sp. W12TSBA100-4 TaxID=3160965 RepID=UPI00330623BE
MKFGTVYAKGKIVTVYRQPSTKKEYEYDTVLRSEEVGISTGQTFSNSTGKYIELVRLGVSELLYVKIDDVSYNIEETLDNLLPTASVKASISKNKLPWIIGSAIALLILIVVIVKK